MRLIQVQITNWHKFQFRADIKAASWFRMDHDVFDSDQFHDLSGMEIGVLVYILCVASKRNGSRVLLNLDKMDARFKKVYVDGALKKLQQLEVITIIRTDAYVDVRERTDAYVDVTSEPVHVRTRALQRERERDKEINIAEPKNANADGTGSEPVGKRHGKLDFEAIYNAYPRKEGRKRGLELCTRLIKTPEDYEKLTQAVKKYTNHSRTSGTEPKFIKHFSSFMASWSDWVEPDAGVVKLQPVPAARKPYVAPEPEPEYDQDPAKAAEILKMIRMNSIPAGEV